MEDVDCGREAGYVWAEGPGGLSVLSAQICYEPKTVLKNKIVCSSSTSYTLKENICKSYMTKDLHLKHIKKVYKQSSV